MERQTLRLDSRIDDADHAGLAVLGLRAVEPHGVCVAHVDRVRELAHGGGGHEAAPEGGAGVGGLGLGERHARLREGGRRNGVVLGAVSKAAQRRVRHLRLRRTGTARRRRASR